MGRIPRWLRLAVARGMNRGRRIVHLLLALLASLRLLVATGSRLIQVLHSSSVTAARRQWSPSLRRSNQWLARAKRFFHELFLMDASVKFSDE
jgi:hypothetical protein